MVAPRTPEPRGLTAAGETERPGWTGSTRAPQGSASQAQPRPPTGEAGERKSPAWEQQSRPAERGWGSENWEAVVRGGTQMLEEGEPPSPDPALAQEETIEDEGMAASLTVRAQDFRFPSLA